MSRFILGQFTCGGRVGYCAGLGFYPSVPAALLPSPVGHRYLFGGLLRRSWCQRWAQLSMELVFLKAFLKEVAWLPCGSLLLSYLVLICWMVSDLAGIPTTSSFASLKVKCFQTGSGFFFLY